MSENVINYLRENKDKYSRQALIESLQKAGYSQRDIDKGVSSVYAGMPLAPEEKGKGYDFWNFRDKLEYKKSSEKMADLFFGIIISIIIIVMLQMMFGEATVVFYLINFFLIVYFASRRIFILAGLAISLLLGPLIFMITSEIFYGFSPGIYRIFFNIKTYGKHPKT